MQKKFTPRPAEVIPLFDECLPPVQDAVLAGIEYADSEQPDPKSRDRWFWAHCARYIARRELEIAAPGARTWSLESGVPNSGIHICIAGIHNVRVLRATAGVTPAPGHTILQQDFWRQLRFLLSKNGPSGSLPPLNLIMDWSTDEDGDLVMNLGLPLRTWKYRQKERVAWHYRLPSDGRVADLTFDDDDLGGPSILSIDDTEAGAS